LLGAALTRALRERQHQVTVLSRRGGDGQTIRWNPQAPDGAWSAAVRDADAVVNLAGEPIDGGRWTDARKRGILNSRVIASRAIAHVVAAAPRPPAVLVNASAVGIYGDRGDEIVTEATPAGSGFLADVCQRWEAEATAAAASTRVVLLRTGLVLDREGGALPRLALPFRFLAGGPVGSGRQWWPWIHIEDWVALAVWAVEHQSLSGPVNLTAPTPVRNAEFARAVGRALRRPAFVPAPAFALRLLLGEMAEALILAGQRAIPERVLAANVEFRYPDLDVALAALFRSSQSR
jgi:uncharacterized protein